MQISGSSPSFLDFSKATLSACDHMQSQVQKKYSAADQLNARELIYADYSVTVAYENKELGTIKARFTHNSVSDVTSGDERYFNIFVSACISKDVPLLKLDPDTYTKVQNLIKKSFGKRTYVTCSIVTVAVVASLVAVSPTLPSSAERAIVKHPACAAARSSSGLVPAPFSNRVLNEYCVCFRTPLSVEMVPLPSFKPPFHTADAFLCIILPSFCLYPARVGL